MFIILAHAHSQFLLKFYSSVVHTLRYSTNSIIALKDAQRTDANYSPDLVFLDPPTPGAKWCWTLAVWCQFAFNCFWSCDSVLFAFLAQDVIYTSRLCYDVSVICLWSLCTVVTGCNRSRISLHAWIDGCPAVKCSGYTDSAVLYETRLLIHRPC